jgi:hypothetical protein
MSDTPVQGRQGVLDLYRPQRCVEAIRFPTAI